jgi:hypothetical protein
MASKLKIKWRWRNSTRAACMHFFVDYYALPVAHMCFTGGGPYMYELFMNVKGHTGQSCIHLNTEEEAVAWLQKELQDVILPAAPRRVCWREVNLFEWGNDHEDMLWPRSQFALNQEKS